MSAPTTALLTLTEIERRLQEGDCPVGWLIEQHTWLLVLQDCLPRPAAPPGPHRCGGSEEIRSARLIATIERELAGRDATGGGPMNWSAPGPGAQLM